MGSSRRRAVSPARRRCSQSVSDARPEIQSKPAASAGGQWTDGGAGESSLGLFQIMPRDNTVDGVQLAGDWPPDDGPPPIPSRKPGTTEGRMKFVRQAASGHQRMVLYAERKV
jgi:hypothetical protein